MKILSVIGARPNFVKIAPILRAIARVNDAPHPEPEPIPLLTKEGDGEGFPLLTKEGLGEVGKAAANLPPPAPSFERRGLRNGLVRTPGRAVESVLVHTEQHYDEAMSAAILADLQVGRPDYTLGVGSGSHATQTAEIMRRFEPVVIEERPDVVLVVGDVNSTAACALTAAKLGVRIAHVEAGLRSFDRSMPEEINRIVTDALSDFLFTTEESANENLRREGHPPEHIFFVGNVMIDSLLSCRRLAERSTILDRLGLTQQRYGTDYALVTLHRPSNVDAAEKLEAILSALAELSWEIPVVLPAHPRTRARLQEFGLTRYIDLLGLDGSPVVIHPGRISVFSPFGYLDFLRLLSSARVVLTDSGGIQDETTCLGVPCLTLRENTERPVTLTAGTSTLVGADPERIMACARGVFANGTRAPILPPLWDGHAAERIVGILVEHVA